MPPPARRTPRLDRELATLLACTALSGCILEDPRSSGVVVLDREAVESGVTLEQHAATHTASALPLIVDSAAPVQVHNDRARQTLLVAPGELVQLRGETLEPFRLAFGQDVDPDRLVLLAPRETVDEIAAQTSAELGELEPGTFELRVANAFVHLSQMDAADVHEVVPLAPRGTANETTGPVSPTALELRDLDRAAPGALPVAAGTFAAELDPVGIYRCESGALVLDAARRFSGCIAELGHQQGSYRLEGRLVTLEAHGVVRTLELDGDGIMSGERGLRCALTNAGEAR